MPGARDTSAGGSSIVPRRSMAASASTTASSTSRTVTSRCRPRRRAAPAAPPTSPVATASPRTPASRPSRATLPMSASRTRCSVASGSGAAPSPRRVGIKPFTGAPGTEFGGAQTPFASTTWYPARMWAASYFGDLAGGSTNLVVTPGAAPCPECRRCDCAPPSLLDHRICGCSTRTAATARLPRPRHRASAASRATRRRDRRDPARIHQRDGLQRCRQRQDRMGHLHLRQLPAARAGSRSCSLPIRGRLRTLWTARLALGSNNANDLRFIVQAANGAALVSVEDNNNAYYAIGGAPAADPDDHRPRPVGDPRVPGRTAAAST